MTPDQKMKLVARIDAAQHACMTGAGYYLAKEPKVAEPKHVRNGIDSAMVQHGALAALLIKKGLITEEEYLESLALGFEKEKAKYERELSEMYKTKITLG